jgi:hypothetical protein
MSSNFRSSKSSEKSPNELQTGRAVALRGPGVGILGGVWGLDMIGRAKVGGGRGPEAFGRGTAPARLYGKSKAKKGCTSLAHRADQLQHRDKHTTKGRDSGLDLRGWKQGLNPRPFRHRPTCAIVKHALYQLSYPPR